MKILIIAFSLPFLTSLTTTASADHSCVALISSVRLTQPGKYKIEEMGTQEFTEDGSIPCWENVYSGRRHSLIGPIGTTFDYEFEVGLTYLIKTESVDVPQVEPTYNCEGMKPIVKVVTLETYEVAVPKDRAVDVILGNRDPKRIVVTKLD